MRSSRIAAGLGFSLSVFAMLLLPSVLLAQSITGLSISKNPGNSADATTIGDNIINWAHSQRLSTVATLSSSATAFQTRYAFVNGADTDAFFTGASSTLAADYKVQFTVTTPGAYDLLVTTTRNLGFSLQNDAGGSGGATASMTAITGGQTGGSLTGTLGFAAPANLSGTGGGSSNLDATNPVATISGSSNGVGVAHQLNFAWSMTCNSQNSGFNSGDACGQRGGIASTVPQLGVVGGYPGTPNRTAANDGHFVAVTLVSYCGNGTVDAGKGETCDEGPANGTPGSCCASDCTLEPATTVCRASSAGEVCDEVEFCTGGSGTCPADLVMASGSSCRAAAGDCDIEETCDGVGKFCPSDDLVSGGTECRGVMGVCDVPEDCTGFDADCPVDDFLPSSVVCRSSSVGEVCDIAESCTGSGPDCPADAVEPASTVCRAAAGDCDVAENCDGAGKTCPGDLVEPSSTVCRAASVGDVCDAVENCDGVGIDCPADLVLPAGTTCRAPAGVCDLEEECGGVSKLCPSDDKSTAECRAAVGVCDIAEDCDGVGDNCPADAFESDGTSCEDVLFCNGEQTCTGGACGGGADPCNLGESCDESTDLCFVGECPANAVACRMAGKSKILIKNKSDDSRDKLIWKFIKGEATTQPDFGDPTTSADYALCLYAGTTSALLEQAVVPPASGKWSTISTKGYKYKDSAGTNDGITRIILKGGAAGKSKAIVKGKGDNLPDFDGDLPISPADLPLIVQLRNNSNGICWEGSYLTTKKNQADQFNAKTPP